LKEPAEDTDKIKIIKEKNELTKQLADLKTSSQKTEKKLDELTVTIKNLKFENETLKKQLNVASATRTQTKLVVKDSTQLQFSVDELIKVLKSAMGQTVTQEYIVEGVQENLIIEEDFVERVSVVDKAEIVEEDIEVTEVKEVVVVEEEIITTN